ncbi:MAG: WbqC family protein [Candidatus Electrothrix sp. Rat3]|nr:WbqC family protein [Candidatus Electrothrix rattekaaiensis]
MQPTYLPWAGYFNLINSVDTFVFLDDVQFEKSSWQSRNRILANGVETYLTVPIKRQGLNTQIKDVLINDNTPWRKKHYMTVSQAYSKVSQGEDIIDLFEEIVKDKSIEKVVSLNTRFIILVSNALGLHTDFVFASDLNCEGNRSSHIVEICKSIAATEYLSPEGAREYLTEDGIFNESNISLSFQKFVPGVYNQIKAPNFVSHLSILDVIANLGWKNTLAYISN